MHDIAGIDVHCTNHREKSGTDQSGKEYVTKDKHEWKGIKLGDCNRLDYRAEHKTVVQSH